MKNQQQAIEKIRASYTEKETTKFDELKALDKKVKNPAKIFAYVFGSLSSLVLGLGMSLAMRVIGVGLSYGMLLGIIIGVLGIALVSINYPIYKAILKARKNKYASKIIDLSNEII